MSTAQFASGTPCIPCQMAGHFCQAHELDDKKRAVCYECLDEVVCRKTPAGRTPPWKLEKPEPAAGVCAKCLKAKHGGPCAGIPRGPYGPRKPKVDPAPKARADVALTPDEEKEVLPDPVPVKETPESFTQTHALPDRSAYPLDEVAEETRWTGLSALTGDAPPKPGSFSDKLGTGLEDATRALGEAFPPPAPSETEDDAAYDGMGRVVDISSIPNGGPLGYKELNQKKFDRAMSLPPGQGLSWDLATKREAKSLYDKFRKLLKRTSLPLQLRIVNQSVYLWKVKADA